MAETGLAAHHTDDLELRHVQINAAKGPAFFIRDSTNLELDGVTTRRPVAGVPVIRLEHCPGAILRGSRAFAGTGTFLSTIPGELKSVVLLDNALTAARRQVEESAQSYAPAAGRKSAKP